MIIRRTISTLLAALWLSAALVPNIARAGEKPAKPLWLVVTRPMFTDAVKPLAEQRRRDGFEVKISTDPPKKALAGVGKREAFVLIVGDDQPGKSDQPWYVPAKMCPAYRWSDRQPKQFASDLAWSDLDSDGMPDFPVGRIPARSAAQVAVAVAKTLKYESRPATLDDLRLPIWAGAPGYGPAIDSMTTSLLVGLVRSRSPAWAQPWVISADLASPFCGWPNDHPAMFSRQLRRGGALACMIGHGNATSFLSMRFGLGAVHYSRRNARAAFAEGPPAPPTIIITCSSGEFTRANDCLAETMLKLPGGPVAVIAATRESHPLPNALTGTSLLTQLGQRHRRLGTLWLATQRQASASRNSMIEKLLLEVEGKLGVAVDPAKLLADQMLLYAILGDPALRLKVPGRLHGRLDITDGAWAWRVDKPDGAGELHVGFRPRGAWGPAGQNLPTIKGTPVPAEARKTFQAANDTFAFRKIATLKPDAPWKGTVRQAGVLRLATIAGGRLYVVALRLRDPAAVATAPASAPAPAGR